MSDARRLDYLMNRELDGEITPVEREELDRLSLAEPSARRAREAWKRFQAGLRREPSAASLDAAMIARRAMTSRPRRSSFRFLPRWVLAGSTLGVVIVFLL